MRIVSVGGAKVQGAYLIALLSSGAYEIRKARRIGHVTRLDIHLATTQSSPVPQQEVALEKCLMLRKSLDLL
jgi:hypothetical protein